MHNPGPAGWQLCNSGSEPPTSFHDAAGKPIVNTSKFQDLKSMTAYAESKGFFLGWCTVGVGVVF